MFVAGYKSFCASITMMVDWVLKTSYPSICTVQERWVEGVRA